AYVYNALTSMHTNANELKENTAIKKKKVVEQIASFAVNTQKLKESLVSLEGDFYVDESSSLREDISTLALGVSGYPGKPTNGQLEKMTELQERLDQVLKQFDAFKTELETINEYLQKKELNAIQLKTFEEFKAG
ncbi:MAG: hypothetical protein AAFP82_19890, partial [Bacteroidota bacterium]